ncbi:sensor histidine kinase [Fulvivirga sediminis]|uniref:histidine kinase n=1 Tax=Fulvivirga sediminis TaxID=2803949 RepID=A0A937F9L0_9BACT|nr:ATP-binding protein [Fulvivirga sediminis]MBL3658220.1 HAMP domain-containing protein [Fulvivirga sediminis]
MGIRSKLTLIIIALCMGVVIVLTSIFYFEFDAALKERVFLQLSSVKMLKIVQVRETLARKAQEFSLFIQKKEVKESFQQIEYSKSWPHKVGKYILNDKKPQNEEVLIHDISVQDSSGIITLAYTTKLDSQYVVAIIQIPEIQQVLMERTGLGETGESYIVGGDYRLRTQSRFYPQKKPLLIKAETEGVKKGLAGGEGTAVFEDYRGVEVFSAYEAISAFGLQWVLLSEIDHDEALLPLKVLHTNILYVFIIASIVVFFISFLVARKIVKPVLLMANQLQQMSRGVLEHSGETVSRDDEIGEMFHALGQLVETMERTIIFAKMIGNGNFRVAYKLLSNEDKLGKSLLQMREQLKKYREQEEKLITEKQLSLLRGQEMERSRLAKEIHDGLGPLLTSMRLRIQALYLSSEKEKELLDLLDQTISEVRIMSNRLMPSVLEDFGIGEAIANLIKFLRPMVEASIYYKNALTAPMNISDDISISLYRIVQEALNNAIKHAKASEIRLSITQFDDLITLFITDNGVGFNTDGNHTGHGLQNMAERVALLNGSFEITSNKKGTTIDIEIPLI